MAPDLLPSKRSPLSASASRASPDLHNVRMASMARMIRLLLSCAALVIAMSVAGCGNSNPSTPTSTPPQTPSTPSTPSTSTVSGLLTDGTSGGILPGIDVQIMSGPNKGMDVKTDSTGHYSFTGVSNGTFSMQFSAVSYVSQTMTVTVSGNTTVNVVLQRS